ncbi:hypothetical protein FHS31_002519 [Sphingomonas vulcanisoli]|uniref:Ice-binding protein C-terminal domain-containing protein n=1 Tax=Sphingomonas vulcanisoli TaxID=1658060 RepID=A0ABX0TWY2_9SPHN|nr:PEPxxWA-CTERM sorting domain-containing protein [Sphingomonas vulcanisoli]NIJ08895.1 hypothetical protein [Sphingomonas vulcanisoli]
MRKLLSYALAGGMLMVAVPASAATFTPFTINLSATDANTATYTYTFDPGTYVVALTQATYTAFAPASPNAGNWADYYRYFVGQSAIDSGSYQYSGTLSTRYATATDAFNAYSAQGPLTLNFSTATTVKFQIGDDLNSLGDNTGGTSLRVTQSAVPEASTWAMMVIGFGAVGYGLRRSKVPAVRFA